MTKEINEKEITIPIKEYFDDKFKSLSQEIKSIVEERRIKDATLTARMESTEKEIINIWKQINSLEHNIRRNTENIEDFEKYKDILNKLVSDMAIINKKIDNIETAIKQRQKNTLAITIAIFSPIITAILMFLFKIPAP